MHGRHVAHWAVYTGDGAVDTVFPPAGKTFALTQSHWFRIEDGQITEHWANRDDLGMARQLGWIPPTPAHLVNMARAKRRARARDLRHIEQDLGATWLDRSNRPRARHRPGTVTSSTR